MTNTSAALSEERLKELRAYIGDPDGTSFDTEEGLRAAIDELLRLRSRPDAGMPNWVETKACIRPTAEAADAFWKYWRENGETHKHGYYESTWGAINAALNSTGQLPVAVECDLAHLLKFYNVATIEEVVRIQSDRIDRLIAKLPPTPDTQPRNYREG